MGYVYYNPNPLKKSAGDCTVRAISKVMGDKGWTWEKTYSALCIQGFNLGDMPSSNIVWGSFLENHGFEYHSLMRKCLECYSVADFCAEHPAGKFVVGTDTHAIAIVDGNVFDIYDSQDMYPTYYFEKEKKGDEA